MIEKYDAFASDLMSISHTEEAPGLPLITGPEFDPVQLCSAFGEAVEMMSHEDRELLNIHGIRRIPTQKYLAMADAPQTLNAPR